MPTSAVTKASHIIFFIVHNYPLISKEEVWRSNAPSLSGHLLSGFGFLNFLPGDTLTHTQV